MLPWLSVSQYLTVEGPLDPHEDQHSYDQIAGYIGQYYQNQTTAIKQ
jgi:hypothetical protein